MDHTRQQVAAGVGLIELVELHAFHFGPYEVAELQSHQVICVCFQGFAPSWQSNIVFGNSPLHVARCERLKNCSPSIHADQVISGTLHHFRL